jgi:broad specificity phosphatase PhoE
MTTRFVLVRHAACAPTDTVLLGRSIDMPLDVRGCAQAHALAPGLAALAPTIVASSPRRRALQTATEIAAQAGCAVRILEELDEVDFGYWSGQRFAALAHDEHWQEWNAQRDTAATPAGETMASVCARALSGLRTLAREFDGATLIAVTHAEIIRTLLLRTRGMTMDRYWQLDVAPASTHILFLRGAELHGADEERAAA